MKETVRGPLGDFLLLGICARIGAGKQREGEHATATRVTAAAGRRESEGRDRETRAIGPMPLTRAACAHGDRPPAHDLTTEHGQARGRLRFRRDVLEGEDHGTVAAPFYGGGLQCGAGVGLLRVDAPHRSGIQLVARVSPSRKILNRQTDQTSVSPRTTSNEVHLFPRA